MNTKRVERRGAVKASVGTVSRVGERRRRGACRGPTARSRGHVGQGRHEVVEVGERLVCDVAGVEILGESVASKDAARSFRYAAVRDAIADVPEAVEPGDVRALARLPTYGALLRTSEDGAPAARSGVEAIGYDLQLSPSRSSTGSISSWKPLETISGRRLRANAPNPSARARSLEPTRRPPRAGYEHS